MFSSSVHRKGIYGFATRIVVDVANIVDGESCHGMATVVLNSGCEYGGGIGTVGLHSGRAGWNSEMLSIGSELFLIRVCYWALIFFLWLIVFVFQKDSLFE